MFAGEGLRTLVLAYRTLDRAFFEEWAKKLHIASTVLDDREECVDALYEEIERDLIVCILLCYQYLTFCIVPFFPYKAKYIPHL